MRIAAYCRVSTDKREQQESFVRLLRQILLEKLATQAKAL